MSEAPAPTRAEEGRETGLRCACSKVPFPHSLEPGYQWCCPCGKSRMWSHAPVSIEARAAQAEAEVARLTAALAEANDRAGVPCPTNHAPTCQHCAAMPEIVAAAQALYEAERDHVMAGQEVAALDHQLSLPQSVEAVQALLPARRAACESASSALTKRQAAQDAVGLSLLPLVRQDSSEKAQA